MESSERMATNGQSFTNRFSDAEDFPPEDCDLKKLMAECEKWSLKNDLQLLTQLKQISSNLIDKSEAANQSMNNLVFNAKMHCVKVDNVINEFQMLANSQFVENRVYDEEVEDIMANGHNTRSDDTSGKPKDEDISTKIKVALNIGLDFLNQRFDCRSQSVPQNDSDDENDQILEGLISNSARDEYSQRVLPYIIGSDEFAKDNYVGLVAQEENPIINLNSRTQADQTSAQSADSDDSEADTFDTGRSNVLPHSMANHLMTKSNDMSDSDEESSDLFGTAPQSTKIKTKPLSSESESESEPFIEKREPCLKSEDKLTNETKPAITSFHDELAAVIGGRRADQPMNVSEDAETEPTVKALKPVLTSTLDSESSDESDSIFNVNKSKQKSAEKSKNFSNLFDDKVNDDSLFDTKKDKPKTTDNDLPKSAIQKIPVMTSSLFDDDDDEDDDLFSAAFSKKTAKESKPIVSNKVIDEPKVGKTNVEKPAENSITTRTNSIAKQTNLFNDDDEEEDDLFTELSSKSKPSPQQIPQKSETPESEVKSIASSLLNKPKPNNSLIGELSAALKKKQLFPSSDEESDQSKSDDQSSDGKDLFSNNEKRAQNDVKLDSNVTEIDVESNEVQTRDVVEEEPTEKIPKEDLLSSEPTATLANDGLKHRAVLGAQRQRRPPTKRGLRIESTDNLGQIQSTSQTIGERKVEKPKPVAAVRSVKPLDDSVVANEPKEDLFSGQTSTKSIGSLIKSPSTEEDDIFPTQMNTKNLTVHKIGDNSENRSSVLLEDSGDDSPFASNKVNKVRNNSNKALDSRGLFDTSDSDDEPFDSRKPSNVISSIIKPSKSGQVFNDVSSTDSSLSTKSDLKTGVSRLAVSLFSDSDDDDSDLFAAVNKNKEKPAVSEQTEPKAKRSPIQTKVEVKTNNTLKKSKSLFSDDDDDEDLFAKKEIKNEIKVTEKSRNSKPVFSLDDSDSDEDLFASKPSKPKTRPTTATTESKPEPKRKNSDLFDDPLFASSRS